jgi:hypothetical protein
MKNLNKIFVVAFLAMTASAVNNSSYGQDTVPLPIVNGEGYVENEGNYNVPSTWVIPTEQTQVINRIKVVLGRVINPANVSIHVSGWDETDVKRDYPTGYGSTENGLYMPGYPYRITNLSNGSRATWTTQFAAALKIRFLVSGNWSSQQYVSKNETINAPAGATQAEVELPEFFTNTNGNAGWNKFYKNGNKIAEDQSVYSISETANYRTRTSDSYVNNPVDTTDFQLVFQVGQHAATPTISTQPQGATYTVGATATPLSVSASVSDGGTLSFQWYSNNSNSNVGGSAIIGATTTSYTPPTSTMGTVYYYVAVTNTNTSVSGTQTVTATSNVVAVVVEQEVHSHKYLDYSITGNLVKVWVVGKETGENYTLQVDGNPTLEWEFTIEDTKHYIRVESSNGTKKTVLEAWVQKK